MYPRRRSEPWSMWARRNKAKIGLITIATVFLLHLALSDHHAPPPPPSQTTHSLQTETEKETEKELTLSGWSPRTNTAVGRKKKGRKETEGEIQHVGTKKKKKKTQGEAVPGPAAIPAPKPSSHVAEHDHSKEEGVEHDSSKWPQLSAELVAKYASDSGKILVTFANHNHEDYIRNWVYHLASIPMDNYLVCAFDDELMEYLVQNGLNGAFVPAVLKKQTFEWGSAGFKKLNRYKWEAALSILEWGFGLFITDADTVYFRDPIKWIEDYGEEGDILASTDFLRPTTWKDELEDLSQVVIAWWAQNIGMMYLAPTDRMVTFMKKWTALMDANPDFGNQWSFTEMLRAGVPVDYSDGTEGYKKLKMATERTFWACNETVTLGILPLAYFQNGHSYFEQRGWEKRNILPVCVHTTYVYAFNGAKRHRFRDEKLWYDDDAYYSEGSFLVFDNIPPPDLMIDHSKDVPFDKVPADHLVLIDYQIQRVFEALAVARVLNRTLVLPPIYATCDRYFAQLDECRYPHAEKDEISFPFPVPADHVFRQELLTEVRESAFLTNPRVPIEVISDRVFINVCDSLTGTKLDVAGVAIGSEASSSAKCLKNELSRFAHSFTAARSLHLRKGLNDVQLAQALAPTRGARILHFSSMEGTFAGFANTDDAVAFVKDARSYIGTWCCTYASGAIHYDSAPEFVDQSILDAIPPLFQNKFPYKDDKTGDPLQFSPPPTPPAR